MSESSKRHSKVLSLIFILKCLSKASVIRIVTIVGKWPRTLLSDLTELTATAIGLLTSHQLHLLIQNVQDLTKAIFLFADN